MREGLPLIHQPDTGPFKAFTVPGLSPPFVPDVWP